MSRLSLARLVPPSTGMSAPTPAAVIVAATPYVSAGRELGELLFGQLCFRIGEERACAFVRYLTAIAPSRRDGSPYARGDHLAGRPSSYDDWHALVTEMAEMEARPCLPA